MYVCSWAKARYRLWYDHHVVSRGVSRTQSKIDAVLDAALHNLFVDMFGDLCYTSSAVCTDPPSISKGSVVGYLEGSEPDRGRNVLLESVLQNAYGNADSVDGPKSIR
jgi:hypothetical protein